MNSLSNQQSPSDDKSVTSVDSQSSQNRFRSSRVNQIEIRNLPNRSTPYPQNNPRSLSDDKSVASVDFRCSQNRLSSSKHSNENLSIDKQTRPGPGHSYSTRYRNFNATQNSQDRLSQSENIKSNRRRKNNSQIKDIIQDNYSSSQQQTPILSSLTINRQNSLIPQSIQVIREIMNEIDHPPENSSIPNAEEELSTRQRVCNNLNSTVLAAINFINTRRINYYAAGVNQNTLLIEIPADKIGTLIGITTSFKSINFKLLPQTTNLFLKYIIVMINNPTSVLAWNKFLLLPALLFTAKKTSTLKEIMSKLENDDWRSFTLGFMNFQKFSPSFATQKSTAPNTTTEKDVIHRIKNYKCNNLVKSGSFRKAFQTVTRKTIQNTLSSDTILEQMQVLHPPLNVENHSIEDKEKAFAPIRETISQTNSQQNNNHITVDADAHFKLIKSRPNDVIHGFDKLRFEHLKLLLGTNKPFQTPQQKSLNEYYCQFLELIINNKIPDDIKPWFHDSHGIPIPKTINTIRPIGIKIIYQRIATNLILQPIYVELRSMFKNLQFGLDKLGTEKIIHSITNLHKYDNTLDIFLMDGNNAFQNLSRIETLLLLKDSFPSQFNFFHSYLSSVTNVWFMSKEAPIQNIPQGEGVTQGDTAGSALYSLGTLPLATQVKEILTEDNRKDNMGYNFLYFDDHSAVAHTEKMKKAVTHVQSRGPKFGYTLNPGKCVMLLGKCSTLHEALEKKEYWKSIGLLSENIKIHPDNFIESSQYENDSYYGAKLLGSFIGTDSFIKLQLEQKIRELESVKNDLINNLDSFQNRMLLFRNCYSLKVNHIFRTLPPHITKQFASQFIKTQKDILSSILFMYPQNLSEEAWIQSNLTFEHGGLEIFDVHITRYSAYAASTTHCLTTILHCLNHFRFEEEPLITSDIHSNAESSEQLKLQFKHYYDTLAEFKKIDDSFTIKLFVKQLISENKLQHILSDLKYNHAYQQIIQHIKDKDNSFNNLSSFEKSKFANFVTNIGPNNSQWLKAIPKFTDYEIKNNEYQSMLLRRLFLYQPYLPSNVNCTCHSKPLIDQFGIHSATCKVGGGKNQTSKNIESTLNKIINYSGLRTISQQLNCFHSAPTQEERNRRPDLSVFDAPNHNKTLLIDVSCVQNFIGSSDPTNPNLLSRIPPNFLTKIIEDYNSKSREGHKASIHKKNKYMELSNNHECDFLPFIMENNGYINEEGVDFLQSLAKRASVLHSIPENNLMKYFLTLLSITLQSNVSRQIINHCTRLNTYACSSKEMSSAYNNIMEHNHNFI
jgi:hypothetical protein